MHEEKQKILDMVANGSISPEEAILLLEYLEDPPAAKQETASAAAETTPETDPSAPDEETAAQPVQEAEPPTETTTVQPISMHTQPPAQTAPLPDWNTDPAAAPEAPEPPVPPQPETSGTDDVPPPFRDELEYPWEDEPQPTQNSYRYEYIVPDAITDMKLSWINGPVVVKAYDGSSIRVTEYCKQELTTQDNLSVTVVNGVLQIKWDSGDRILSFARMIGRSFLAKHLTVEVPAAIAGQMNEMDISSISGSLFCSQFAAQRVKLSTTSGKIHISGIGTQVMKLSSVSGSAHLANCASETINISSTSCAIYAEGFSAGTVNFDTVSGRITTSGSATVYKANTVSGKIQSTLYAMPERVKLDSISGRVTLTIPENDGFTVKYSSLSGILQSDFPLTGNIGQKNGKATYANGLSSINISTMSGRMRIHKGA